MFETIFLLLLRLYPSRFRDEYGEEALQLFRDRTRDETGVWRSARLWLDLLTDMAISLPREYHHARSAMLGASVKACWEGAPTFFVFDTASPGRVPLLLGGLLSLVTLVSFPLLINDGSTLGPQIGWRFASAHAFQRQSTEPQKPTLEGEHGVAQSPPGQNPRLDAAFRHRIIANTIG